MDRRDEAPGPERRKRIEDAGERAAVAFGRRRVHAADQEISETVGTSARVSSFRPDADGVKVAGRFRSAFASARRRA